MTFVIGLSWAEQMELEEQLSAAEAGYPVFLQLNKSLRQLLAK